MNKVKNDSNHPTRASDEKPKTSHLSAEHGKETDENPYTLQKVAEKLMLAAQFQDALDFLLAAYSQGRKNYETISRILKCYRKLNQEKEIIDFLSKAVLEAQLSRKEQAHLYYRLGELHLAKKHHRQAKQAFWQVRKIASNYPGLQEKLKELDPGKSETSRYSQLLEKKLLSSEKLTEATEKAKKEHLDLDQLLLDEYNVPKKELGESLSSFYEVPFVPFDPGTEPPYALFEKRKPAAEFLKRSGWVPLEDKGEVLVVLMSNPFDLDKLDEIKFIYGTNQVEPRVAVQQDIESFVSSFYNAFSQDDNIAALSEEVEAELESEPAETPSEEDISEHDSEVVRLANAIMVEAWRKNASDIHIEPYPRERFCEIRFRIDGDCHVFHKIRHNLSRPLISRIKIMARLNIADRRLPQDGKFKIKIPGENKYLEFRVATMPTMDNQEDVVLRILASGKPMPLQKLGMADHTLGLFQKCIDKPYGLILVVGPTGSGKTTTLHSALSNINVPERKIWTAEDPIEISQRGLRQVQVNPKIGLSFAAALRSFLRSDPDVIMIGEMRDEETAHIGIEASLTGHLVFSTLHTNSAPETVSRLLDMNLDPYNFADSLICVLAQRLVKTLCPYCKKEYHPDKKEFEAIKREFGPGWDSKMNITYSNDLVLYKAEGCSNCVEGYRGRIGVHELMVNSQGIKTLIKNNRPTENIRDQALQDGMMTLKQDGIHKVMQGITDMQQVRAQSGS